MIRASQQFQQMVRDGANVVNYATITLRDGTVLDLEPSDFMINGCNIEDSTTDGAFGVGYAVGKTVSIAIANYEDQYTDYDFYKATFVLYCALKIGNQVEKVRKGVYYVLQPETPGEIIQFSGVDAMHFFDRAYDTDIQYPTTLQVILADACLKCGVEAGFTRFENDTYVALEKPQECTYREVISWVAQISGKNARINNFGALELVWWETLSLEELEVDGQTFEDHESHDYVIEGGDFLDYTTDRVYNGGTFLSYDSSVAVKELVIGTDVISITGVKVKTDKAEVLVGTEDYCIIVAGNDLAIDKEQEVAEYLYGILKESRFRTMTAKIPCNPLFEPFDTVTIQDRKGHTYTTLINSVSYHNGGYTILSCEADPPVRNESYYQSEASKAVAKARRDTRETLSNYDLAVQNMNTIAANAMGFFTTYEDQPDGSRIVYLHNKPTLLESMTIYKMSSDGFFISTDGGRSYTAGIDAQGNAVVNVLSAIGIQFDWARGGTLTLGGQNNINGEIQIINAEGVPCGKINNAGISIYSPTSQVQVIITPEIGLVMRDADGNEFYGLSTRQNFVLMLGTNYRIFRTYRIYQSKLGLRALVLDRLTVSTAMLGSYKYKFKFYWYCEPIWLATDNAASAQSDIILTLPETFKDKNISVQINNNGMSQSLIDDSSNNKIFNHYESNVITTKADGTEWTDSRWSNMETWRSWEVGSVVDVSTAYFSSVGDNTTFWHSCEKFDTAFNYGGTEHALGTLPVENDFLTDMPAGSIVPTSGYSYENQYEIDNTVPSVEVTGEATLTYTQGMRPYVNTDDPYTYVYTWSQKTDKNINLPISDLLDLTMIATC